MEYKNVLPSKKYINAPNQNQYLNLNLNGTSKQFDDLDKTILVSAFDIFKNEINSTNNYKLYFTLQYNNILLGKNKTINKISDIFTQVNNNRKTFYDDFDIFVCYLNKLINVKDNIYQQYFSKLTKISDIKTNNFSFNKDIFNNETYSITINKTFNIENLNTKIIQIDDDYNELIETEIPISSLYIFFQPKKSVKLLNPNSFEKVILHPDTTFGYNNEEIPDNILQALKPNDFTLESFRIYFIEQIKLFCSIFNINPTLNNLYINKILLLDYLNLINQPLLETPDFTDIKGDFIEIDKSNFLFNKVSSINYIYDINLIDTYIGDNINNYIALNYNKYNYTLNSNNITIPFTFKFNPFIEIPLKKYSDGVVINNNYGFLIEGNTISRSFINNSDNEAFDFPYINDVLYVYENLILNVNYYLNNINNNVLINDLKTFIDINQFKLDKAKQISNLKTRLC